MTTRNAPPGWRPHQIDRRLDGWIVDPANEAGVPAGVAEVIARALPQPSARNGVAAIRARMEARQRVYNEKKKVSLKRQRMFEGAKSWTHE